MDRVVLPIGKVDGEIRISGAKNSSLLLLAASVLATNKVVLENLPLLEDVKKMCEILNLLNVKTKWIRPQVLEIDPSNVQYQDLDIDVCSEIRTSLLFVGIMLGRFGKVRVKSPGGCRLGPRPINFHIEAMREMGAEIVDNGDYVEGTLSISKDAYIHFGKVTVTGLVNAMFCAVTRNAETVIRNCALEPEVDDCIEFLLKLGANIRRIGSTVVIKGGKIGGGARHAVIPDRLEAGTFLIMATMVGGSLTVRDVIPDHMQSTLEKLREAGAEIIEGEDSISLKMSKRPKACDILACPYPGFPTDLQPQWCALSAISSGRAKIVDLIYPGRFDHMLELERMGVKYDKFDRGVLITGVEKLSGSYLVAKNLRSAAALILAALVADRPTEVQNLNHLLRGYEEFFEKLAQVSEEVLVEK